MRLGRHLVRPSLGLFVKPTAAARRCLVAALAAAIACNASAQDLQAKPAHITPALARSSLSTTTNPARGTAAAIRAERLEILVAERNKALTWLEAAKRSGDPAAITRYTQDLAALDREISSVTRQPTTEPKRSAPSSELEKPTTAATAAPPESQSVASETAFEGWDVFKNFGNRRN